MKKVLIGSTVRQDPRILEYFLDSLRDLEKNDFAVDFMFVDDNENPAAAQLLQSFRPLGSRVVIQRMDVSSRKDEQAHHWTEKLIWRVAWNKNLIIEHCRKELYDHLFLVDSDLVLHPATLARLIATGKDIISEIFWTKWRPDMMAMPNVWLMDQYALCKFVRGEKIMVEEITRRTHEFLNMLRKPGVYKVGGLGACTLFSRQVLEKGVCFSEIYNISFWGEDRHLCIRAAALGFELFVDTFFPCYHIYRESELEGVPEYLASMGKISLDTHNR